MSNIETLTVNTWLPCFPGFYESPLFSYDAEEAAANEIVRSFTDKLYGFPSELLRAFFSSSECPDYFQLQFNGDAFRAAAAEEFCEQVEILGLDRKVPDWPVVRIEYGHVESPREYNFYTDVVRCKVTFMPEVLDNYIRSNMKSFQKYLDDKYTSRSGFVSHYDPDPAVFLDRNEWTRDEHLVGALLDFVIKDQLGPDAEAILSERVLVYVPLTDHYEVPEAVSDWLESDEAEELAAEYCKVKQQCEDYVAIMGAKYSSCVKKHMRDVVNNMVEDMIDGIKNM